MLTRTFVLVLLLTLKCLCLNVLLLHRAFLIQQLCDVTRKFLKAVISQQPNPYLESLNLYSLTRMLTERYKTLWFIKVLNYNIYCRAL